MADTGIVDLDSHLVSLGRSHLNILDGEVLAGLPGHGGLAGDGLSQVSPSQLSLSPLFIVRGYGGVGGMKDHRLTFPTVSAIACDV
jgi:hypothetical protein